MDTNDLERRFSALVAREGDGLFRFLAWSLAHREDALDALQDVLVRVHRALGQLRADASERAWLYRIATNVAHDARARRRRLPRTFGLVPDEGSAPRLLGSREEDPSGRMVDRESHERLQARLDALPRELREPLLLHVVSGFKYREVAEALGWPIGTVTSRIHAARTRLEEGLR